MFVYWFISLTVFLLSILDVLLSSNSASINIRRYLYLLSSFILIIFGGIRGLGTGFDDIEYREFYNLFYEVKDVFGIEYAVHFFRYEPITYLISILTDFFTNNPTFFIFAYCLISVSINSFFFIRLTSLPAISIAIYSSHLFINKDMNQIRFGLSSAFFLGFVCFLISNKRVKCFSFFLLSFFSHATGIIALIPVFLSKFKIKTLPIWIVLVSIPLSYLGSSTFIEFISAYLGSVGERAMDYANDSVSEQGVLSFGNLKNIIFIFVFSYFLLSDKIKDKDLQTFNKYFILVLIFSLGGAFRIFFKDYASGSRLANYFLQVEPVLLSLLVYEVRGIKRVCMLLAVLFVIIYYLYYNTYLNPQSIHGYYVDSFFSNIF